MLDRETQDNIDRLLEYFETPNIKRRFVEKCSRLDDQQLAIVQDILKGVRISETPAYSEYLLKERPFLKLLSETLFEIPDAEQSNNPGLHDALIFIEEHFRGDEIKYWRSLFVNKHVSANDIRRMVDLELRGGVASLMFGFGPDLRNIAELPNAPVDVLERFLEIEDVTLWKYAARNANCPESVLLYLLSHKKKKVRELVAQAPNATAGMLLKMLDDNDASVVQALSKRTLHIPFETGVAMVLKNIAITPKAVKSLLAEHPEIGWLELGINNRKHSKLFIKARKNSDRECSHGELIERYELAVKTALDNTAVPDSEADDLKAAEDLQAQYDKHPEAWETIIQDRRCSDTLLKQMFLDGHDVTKNPVIQKRLAADIEYMRRLTPQAKKDRLHHAKNNKSSEVLYYLYAREYHAKAPDMDVLKALCANPHTDEEALKEIYHHFKLKEVSKNPNCPKNLRKRLLQQ